jgi:hypothetical protein
MLRASQVSVDWPSRVWMAPVLKTFSIANFTKGDTGSCVDGGKFDHQETGSGGTGDCPDEPPQG